MSTSTYLFTGKTKWAKLQPDKPDTKFGEQWQLPLYLDAKSWVDYEKSGIRLEVKKDKETGEPYVTFRRKVKEMHWKKGAMQENGPVKVVIANQYGEYEPFDGLIGNGSSVSAKVDVFDTKNGKGHRLVAVGVDNLVEYNPDGVGESNVPKMPF